MRMHRLAIEGPQVKAAHDHPSSTEAPMAENRMSRFEVFIGTWNTTGEVLQTESAPATSLSATDSYRWLPGRHFICHDADARFGARPTRSTEVTGRIPMAIRPSRTSAV